MRVVSDTNVSVSSLPALAVYLIERRRLLLKAAARARNLKGLQFFDQMPVLIRR